MGSRTTSVEPCAPANQVRIPSIKSNFFKFKFELYCEKDEKVNKKGSGLAHISKSYDKINLGIIKVKRWISVLISNPRLI